MLSLDLSHIPRKTNEAFIPLYKDYKRYEVLYGGAGSGKSHFIVQKHLYRILKGSGCGVKHKFLFLRKTQPAARKSVFELTKKYIEDWGLQDICHINRTEMSFVFVRDGQVFGTIICGGLDDESKLKSIEGITGIWLEEADEFLLQDFKQADLRLRGKTGSYKQICLTFNPVSKLTWVFKRFFTGDQKDTTIHHSTHKDNRFLDKEYVAVLENLIDEDANYHRVYALGEWGTLSGLILSNWDTCDEMPDDCEEYRYGLDFGHTHPSALLHIGFKGEKDIYIDEIIHQTKLTNTDLIELFKELGVDDDTEIIADSAEPDRIEEIGSAGYFINPAKKGKHSIRHSIDVLKRKQIHFTKRSVNTINEAQSWKWKQDKDGNEMEEPVKFKDDAMAALRYGAGQNYADGDLVWGS